MSSNKKKFGSARVFLNSRSFINKQTPLLHGAHCREMYCDDPNTTYVRLNWENFGWRAHRLSYVEEYGDFPDDKPYACHHCDNRRCIEPAHLFAGSALDNVRDMDAKGRRGDLTGEKNGMFGTVKSPEERERIRQQRLGSKHTSETCALITKLQTGSKRNDETKERMSIAQRKRIRLCLRCGQPGHMQKTCTIDISVG